MPDLTSVAGLPRWHPPPQVLELAELVLDGALAALPAGLPEPPADGEVVLEDAEGTPVAVLSADRSAVSALQPFAQGPLRSARRTPAQVRELVAQRAGGRGRVPVLAVPVAVALGREEVEAIQAKAVASGEIVLWLALVGEFEPYLPPSALWRAVRAVAEQTTAVGAPSLAVPVALPADETRTRTTHFGPVFDEALLDEAARAYGATQVWHFAPGHFRQPGQADDVHPVFEHEWSRVFRPPRHPGATIFFTGLSGSGKSTVAKALTERLTGGDEEFPGRSVSLLDGDEVRRMLSSGLGFSRADRDLNILRIGYVAAEVARHGGLAVCAPIAPFDVTRQQVRQQTLGAGGRFLLIHVSTPLAECERRDRKGLYARARSGEIAEFTGISSPYEDPADADLRLDTSDIALDEAVDRVWELIRANGLLDPG